MIAIISDIHGNFPALHAVLEDIDRKGTDTIYCLGDITGYYCMVNECIEALKARETFSLMGNHDYYILNNLSCPRSETATNCLRHQQSVLTSANRNWLSNNKHSEYALNEISMVHGGWNDPLDEYLYEISESYFQNYSAQYFFAGHNHVQYLKVFSNKTIFCNPGSVGQPRDGDSRAAYALLDENGVHLHRIPYEIEAIAFQMKKAGFSDRVYNNLFSGTRIGGKTDSITAVS